MNPSVLTSDELAMLARCSGAGYSSIGDARHDALTLLTTVAGLRETLADVVEALEFSWKYAEDYLVPWTAWTEYGEPQRQGYHCWGCSGEFVSVWPEWKKPNDETFSHSHNCQYLAYKAALAKAKEGL